MKLSKRSAPFEITSTSMIEPLEPRQFLANTAGVLDSSFAGDGKLLDATQVDLANSAVAVESGKFVVAGLSTGQWSQSIVISRYWADGQLDGVFGDTGQVLINVQNPSGKVSVAAQPDGKLVVAARNGDDVLVTRLLSNGTIDATFGDHGTAIVDGGYPDYPFGLAIRADGRILLGLMSGLPPASLFPTKFVLLQLNAAGTPDGTFGTAGNKVVDLSAFTSVGLDDLALDRNGRIIAVGRSTSDALVIRLTPAGDLDSTFATGGILQTPSAQVNSFSAIVVQRDGGLLVGGRRDNLMLVRRITVDGELDTTFGQSGQAGARMLNGPDLSVTDLTVLRGGKIVITGHAGGYNITRQRQATAFAAAAFNADGTPDNTFGGGEAGQARLLTSISRGADQAGAVVSLGKGRFAIAGGGDAGRGHGDIAIAGYTPDGKLNLDFGDAGKVETDVASPAEVTAVDVARLASGDVLVLSNVAFEGGQRLAVNMYGSDGAPSSYFHGGEPLILSFDPADYANAAPLGAQIVLSADQSKFAVVGTLRGPAIGHVIDQTTVVIDPTDRMFASMYEIAGTPVTTFGDGGTAIHGALESNWTAHAATFQGNKLLIAGANGGPIIYDQNTTGGAFALVRFQEDGSLDTSFGNQGVTLTTFTAQTLPLTTGARDLAIQDDGKIILVGVDGENIGQNGNENNKFAIARYTANGVLDTTFGTGGKVTHRFGTATVGDIANSVAIQPDGKILIAGAVRPDATISPSSSDTAAGVLRLNADGSLDHAFGTGGEKAILLNIGTGSDSASKVLIQRDGKILLLGSSRHPDGVNNDNDFLLVRLLSDGTADPSFGKDEDPAIQTTDFGGEDFMTGATLLNDGSIVAVGYSRKPNGHNRFAMSKYFNDQAQITATVENGEMVIRGSGGDDTIILARTFDGAPALVGITGPAGFGDTSQITGWRVEGGAGRDYISADLWNLAGGPILQNPLTIPVSLDGGSGDDTILGGPAADTLVGGTGQDSIVSGAGDVVIDP